MSKKIKLSTEIDCGKQVETYDLFGKSLVNNQADKLMSKSVINSTFVKSEQVPPYEETERQLKKQRKIEREKTTGRDWNFMSVGELTEEAKNDLAVIKMRGALHKDRFYKANDSDTLPKFFQMGKIEDDPIDYYSSRVPRKQQKKTILEELLDDAKVKKFAKKNYSIIQAKEEKRRKHLARMSKRIKKK